MSITEVRHVLKRVCHAKTKFDGTQCECVWGNGVERPQQGKRPAHNKDGLSNRYTFLHPRCQQRAKDRANPSCGKDQAYDCRRSMLLLSEHNNNQSATRQQKGKG